MKLLIASNNAGKIAEIRQIFEGCFEEIVSLKQAGICLETEETGTTFAENALLKAEDAARFWDGAVLADDSGLEVDALGGAPGIYSARYAGEPCDDDANNRKLLETVKDVPDGQRTARFVCSMVLLRPGKEPLYGYGTVEGTLGYAAVGDGGFGYDALFIPLGYDITTAQMTAREKNAISHRNAALSDLRRQLMQEVK